MWLSTSPSPSKANYRHQETPPLQPPPLQPPPQQMRSYGVVLQVAKFVAAE